MSQRPRIWFPLLAALGVGLPGTSGADDFTWDPITAADWAVIPDPSKGIHSAVMLFEKISADDTKFLKSNLQTKAYLTIYRRIKVFEPEGHDFGEVVAPFVHRHEEIEEIRARTLLPDGREILLTKPEVHEKEIYKSKGLKVKQKAFSLPGIASGCIVEYRLKYRLPYPNDVWVIQKEIPLRHGEYRWLFYRGRGLDDDEIPLLAKKFSPNYFYLHTVAPLKVEIRPSEEDPEEVFFSVDDVPAFVPEPYSPPEIALQTQVRCYYGAAANPDSFWAEAARETAGEIRDFCKSDGRLHDALAAIKPAGSDQDKIESTYAWLQRNIKNVTYLEGTEDEFKDNDNADDTLKRRYGTQEDINLVFYHMLRQFNIGAWMTYVVDRDESFFVWDAKYWQFDRSLVAARAADGQYRLYSPGDLFLPPSHLIAVNEGAHALMLLDGGPKLVKTPHSAANLNRTRRTLNLRVDSDSEVSGRMVEQRTGHAASTIRLLLMDRRAGRSTPTVPPVSTAAEERLHDLLEEEIPNAELDSVAVEGGELGDTGAPITVLCHLKLPQGRQLSGSRLFLQPFGALNQSPSPFQTDERRYPIVFDHAYELTEMLNIDLGTDWKVDALPADKTFVNTAGRCEAKFACFGQTLSVQRLFRLDRPFWSVAEYPVVRELFRTFHGQEILAVVLSKSAPRSSE